MDGAEGPEGEEEEGGDAEGEEGFSEDAAGLFAGIHGGRMGNFHLEGKGGGRGIGDLRLGILNFGFLIGDLGLGLCGWGAVALNGGEFRDVREFLPTGYCRAGDFV